MITQPRVVQIGLDHIVVKGDKILRTFNEIADDNAIENAYNFVDEMKRREQFIKAQKQKM